MSVKLKLHVRKDIGQGQPLVLLHGMFAESSQWDEIARLLSDDYRVITVDLLGHGQSPRPKNARYTAKEHATALRNTLESLDATQDLTIVGYSMGGAVAMAYSAAFPDHIDQLYLISTPFYLEPDDMIPVQYAGSLLFTKASTGFFSLIERIMKRQSVSDKITKFGNESKFFHSMIGADNNELDAVIIRKNLHQLIRKFDFVGNLKKIKAPLTFYAGKKDLFIVQGQLDALRRYQPNMDIQRLDIIKIDHMLVQNLPHEIARLVRKNQPRYLNVGFDEGKGQALVLLHGIESSSTYWQALRPALKANKRLIGIDLLGFGNSPQPLNIGYTLDEQVAWLDKTIQQLGLKRVEFMAHSLGSLVAMGYAARYPTKVKSLTLFSPVFVPQEGADNRIIKRIHFIDKISDGSYLYSQTARALGYARMSKYLPLIRTVKNTVQNQDWLAVARDIGQVPIKILVGAKDYYIDMSYLSKITTALPSQKTEILPKEGHNFPFFNPKGTAKHLGLSGAGVEQIKRTGPLPKTFLQQMAKLASPILIAKSLLYIGVGLSLFTQYAPWTVTLGLAYYVFRLGYSYIRGAFSLKNENLSYLGYIILGVIGIGLSYFLFKRPELALEISILVICGLIFLAGLSRVIVALAWTHRPSLRRGLFLAGAAMMLVGALAFGGGELSATAIRVGFAVIIILRGLQFGIYATTALVLAYVRGYN